MSALRNTLRGLAVWVARHLAKRYVAGDRLTDALVVCRHAATSRDWGSTLGFWNTTDDPAEKVAAHYRTALRALADEALDCTLALKAPAFGYDRQCLAELLMEAQRSAIRLHFDAQDPGSATATFTLLEDTVRLMAVPVTTNANSCAGNPCLPMGCTLPGRWLRSLDDVDKVVELGLPVRIVKGQWADPAAPSRDPRTGFLELVEALAGRVPRVGIATHDRPLAIEALSRLKRAGTPCELEQLYGLPMIAAEIPVALRVPIRVYVPYGQGFMPYALSLAVKKPQVTMWLLRDLLRGQNGL